MRKSAVKIRSEMATRIPRWLQKPLTSVSALAAPEEKEWIRQTPGRRFAQTMVQFLVGIAGSVWLLEAGGLAHLFLPFTILMTAGANRAFQTTFLHHGSHDSVSTTPWINDLMAELAAVVAWLQTLEDYRRDHRNHHGALVTEIDPDLDFVKRKLGFLAGLTRRQYWRHLWKTNFSPVFHLRLTATRLHGNLVASKGLRRTASWFYLILLLGITAYFNAWLTLTIAYVLPVILMHNMAAFLQTISEHVWVRLGQGRDPKLVIVRRLTYQRYFTDPLPKVGAGWIAWSKWWMRLVFIHAPLRYWIVPIDLPYHAVHHENPTKFDWARGPFALQEIQTQIEKSGISDRFVLGLGAAIDLTFAHLELLPPDSDLGEPKSYGFIDPDLLSM